MKLTTIPCYEKDISMTNVANSERSAHFAHFNNFEKVKLAKLKINLLNNESSI